MGFLERLRSVLGKTPSSAPVAVKPSGATVSRPQPAAQVERRTRERIDAREGTRVLIVDDSPTIVAALKKFIRSAGYVTLEAFDAEKGIELAVSQKPDLIFLDIVLPGMNGFAALRQLRRDPATRDIPVIMISGNEQATEQFFGSRIGADDFMKKPFSRYEIFARIERLLDQDRVPRRVSALASEPEAAATELAAPASGQ